MSRFLPSLWTARRHGARLVALLFAAHLALFAHLVGHDYGQDAIESHGVCGLCVAAQQLDHGLPSAPFDLPVAQRVAPAQQRVLPVHYGPMRAAFQARAPPHLLS
jgi:hypothetical protein